MAIKVISLLLVVLFIAPMAVFTAMWAGCRSDVDINLEIEKSLTESELEGFEKAKNSLVNYFRNEEQTYLTFPEWYIVYSAEEYAAYLKQSPPSNFPYFRSIRQYWSSYCHVYSITRDNYPFNLGYHVIMMVIGNSYSVEYAAKGIYENTVGRLTEWLGNDDLTEEEKFAQQVAEEYGKFLHTIPWYEFPFGDKLKQLWVETDLWGTSPVRKWERKVILSSEYGFKSVYGWLIRNATQTTYGDADLEIYALVNGYEEDKLQQFPDVRLVEKISPDIEMIVLPRYEAFTQTVPELSKQGVEFLEFAGNDEIMITVLVPNDWELGSKQAGVLLSMEILTDPGFKRLLLNVPVANLNRVLTDLENEGIRLEHIYDY